MPLSEQQSFLDEGITSRLPDFSVPIGIVELAAYIRNHVSNTSIELLDVAVDLHGVFRQNIGDNGVLNNRISTERFYYNEIDSVNMEPDIVGVSILYSTSYFSSLKLMKLARKKWPKALMIVGGNHASGYYKTILKNDNIDLLFRGEAETSFTEYLDLYNKQGKNVDVNKIVGVYDYNKLRNQSDGSPVESAPYMDSLDQIGLPAYDLLNLDMYKITSSTLDRGSISVMWSRGCPFKCTFLRSACCSRVKSAG